MKLITIVLILLICLNTFNVIAESSGNEYPQRLKKLIDAQIEKNEEYLLKGEIDKLNFIIDGYSIINNDSNYIFKNSILDESILSKTSLENYNTLLRNIRIMDQKVFPYVVLIPPFPQLLRNDIDINSIQIEEDSLALDISKKLYKVKTENTKYPLSILTLSSMLQINENHKVSAVPYNYIYANTPLNNLLSESKSIVDFQLDHHLKEMKLMYNTNLVYNLSDYYAVILDNFKNYVELINAESSYYQFSCDQIIADVEREDIIEVATEEYQNVGIQKIIEQLQQMMSSDKYTYLELPKESSGYIYTDDDKEKIEDVIDEKLKVYNKVVGKKIFALNITVDFFIARKNRDSFSVTLYEKIKDEFKDIDQTTTLFLELYFSKNEKGSLKNYNCIIPMSFVLGFDAENIKLGLGDKLLSNNKFNVKFVDVYCNVLKPSIEYRYYLKFTTEPIFLQFTHESSRKYPFIYDLEIYYDKVTSQKIDIANNILKQINDESENIDPDRFGNQEDYYAFLEDLKRTYEAKKNELIASSDRGLFDLTTNGLDHLPMGWERYPSQLREGYIPRGHKAYIASNFHFSNQSKFVEEYLLIIDFLKSDLVGEDDGGEIRNLGLEHYYKIDGYKVFDKYIYGSLDIISFVPILDTGSDILGFIYASARGDELNMFAYGTGITIVGIGGVAQGLKIPLGKSEILAVLKNNHPKIYYKGQLFKINSEIYVRFFLDYLKGNFNLNTLNPLTPQLIIDQGNAIGLYNPWARLHALNSQKDEIQKQLLKITGEESARRFVKRVKRGRMKVTLDDYKNYYNISDDVFSSIKNKYNNDLKLQQHFEDLLVDATEGKTAVLALLKNYPTNKIDQLVEKINSLGSQKRKFLIDCNASDELLEAFVNDIELVDSWDLLKMYLGDKAEKQLSIDILEIVKKDTNDIDYMHIITPNDLTMAKKRYVEMIKIYSGSCKSCTLKGSKYLPNNPKDFFNEVAFLTKKFKDKNGISIFNEAKGGYQSQEGIWHTMKQLKEIDIDIVEKLDDKFTGVGLPCINCKYDVKLIQSRSNKIKFIEYKSKNDASSITLSQFKNYLSQISDLNELNYVFSSSKISLEEARKGIANVIKNNAADLWDLNPDLFFMKTITLNKKKISLDSKKTLIEVSKQDFFYITEILDFIIVK